MNFGIKNINILKYYGYGFMEFKIMRIDILLNCDYYIVVLWVFDVISLDDKFFRGRKIRCGLVLCFSCYVYSLIKVDCEG